MNPNLALVQNGAVYTDYESVLASINWCTPTLLGFSVCANASAAGGLVTLQLTLKTPFGNYSKTFQFNSNVCYEWNLPIKFGPSIKVCISNLSSSPTVCFDLSISLCLNLIVTKKCATWSHRFCLPFMAGDLQAASSSISTEDLSSLALLLAHSAGDDSQQCNCH